MTKRSHRFPRHLTAVLLVSLGAGTAQAQLNDTGQDTCNNGSALVTCTTANTGDTATYPRQDGRFGRDAAAAGGVLTKVGGGAAGFDFTKVCMSGELAGQGSCPANPLVGTGPNEWACTRDNVTGLIWSLDSPTYNWWDATTIYPDVMNATNRCGYNTGWRVPPRRELLSIVHFGASSDPVIDVNYFPNTSSGIYWSADTPATAPANAWSVNFGYGDSDAGAKKDLAYHVRLVRSGQ